MLLADVFGSVSKTGLLKEIEFWALEKTRIAVVFVGQEQRHGFLHLGDAQLVQLVNRVLLFL